MAALSRTELFSYVQWSSVDVSMAGTSPSRCWNVYGSTSPSALHVSSALFSFANLLLIGRSVWLLASWEPPVTEERITGGVIASTGCGKHYFLSEATRALLHLKASRRKLVRTYWTSYWHVPLDVRKGAKMWWFAAFKMSFMFYKIRVMFSIEKQRIVP